MTPAGRIAAAIELLAEVEAATSRPADAVANDFFRARRFIGAGDRRAVSERVWGVLRTRRRLGWWLGRAGEDRKSQDRTSTDHAPTPRLLVAASLLFDGWTPSGLGQAFSGENSPPRR